MSIGSVVRINNTEKQLMRLVKQNQLSVEELVKCVECGIVDVSTNDMRKLAGNYVPDGPFAWQFAFVNTLADERLQDEFLSFEEKMAIAAPVCTANWQYFKAGGPSLGGWGAFAEMKW